MTLPPVDSLVPPCNPRYSPFAPVPRVPLPLPSSPSVRRDPRGRTGLLPRPDTQYLWGPLFTGEGSYFYTSRQVWRLEVLVWMKKGRHAGTPSVM